MIFFFFLFFLFCFVVVGLFFPLPFLLVILEDPSGRFKFCNGRSRQILLGQIKMSKLN